MTLEELINDPEYAEIFEESKEEKELRESLFNGPNAKKTGQTFAESMAILSSGKDPLIK